MARLKWQRHADGWSKGNKIAVFPVPGGWAIFIRPKEGFAFQQASAEVFKSHFQAVASADSYEVV